MNIYLYDHPSGDKEVGGGRRGKGVVPSIDRSIERIGHGAATDRQRIGLFNLNVSFDDPFAYYTFMHSITHSTLQSKGEPTIRLFLTHNRGKVKESQRTNTFAMQALCFSKECSCHEALRGCMSMHPRPCKAIAAI